MLRDVGEKKTALGWRERPRQAARRGQLAHGAVRVGLRSCGARRLAGLQPPPRRARHRCTLVTPPGRVRMPRDYAGRADALHLRHVQDCSACGGHRCCRTRGLGGRCCVRFFLTSRSADGETPRRVLTPRPSPMPTLPDLDRAPSASAVGMRRRVVPKIDPRRDRGRLRRERGGGHGRRRRRTTRADGRRRRTGAPNRAVPVVGLSGPTIGWPNCMDRPPGGRIAWTDHRVAVLHGPTIRWPHCMDRPSSMAHSSAAAYSDVLGEG